MDPEDAQIPPTLGDVVEKEEPRTPEKTFTPEKIKMIISIVYGNLFFGCSYSLMAPFFPAMAESKGCTPSQYGLVFGFYDFAMFVAFLALSKLGSILNPAHITRGGMLASGICLIVFGFLEYSPPGNTFIGLAASVRALNAVAVACFVTGVYTITACELQEILGRAMALIESCFAIGMAVGPVIGGVLFEVGGFKVPFVTLGCAMIVGAAFNLFLIPKIDNSLSSSPASARKLLSNLDFLLNVLGIFSTFLLMGFNEVTLEPHLRQFILTPTAVGSIFLVAGIIVAVFGPLFGLAAEKISNPQHMSLIGGIFFLACFLIIGPIPFFHLPSLLWIVILSQAFLGLGMSLTSIASYTHGFKSTVEMGFPDDASTYSLVSGVLLSSMCIGGFLGTVCSGYLIDTIGYGDATTVVSGFEILVVTTFGVRLGWLYEKGAKKETLPTISHNNLQKAKGLSGNENQS